MTSADRRRELRARYERRPSAAGVYALRNTATGRVLVASAADLGAVRSRLEFAKATGTPSALDHRLVADARELGLDVFSLEILDVLDVRPGTTPDEVRADLGFLEQLWREKMAGEPQY